MPEITRPGEKTRQSIAPSTSAPTAPTMDAPGARTMTDPTPSSSRRREAATREKFEGIEREYQHSKYVGYKARRGDYRPKPAPETPVSDAYVITMRKQGAAPGIVSLDDLVIQSEQREREQWLRDEEYRAAVLPHQIQAEVQQAAWHDSINQYYAQQNKAAQEQRERDTEAQKYGYETDAELQAAIREEKAIKRANELGLALTEAQLITQTVAREGYAAATDFYGRDPGELIEEQRQIGAAAQASLETNFGIEIGPKPQEYFQAAAAVPVTVREREAAHTRLQGVIDPINAAIEAGTPASELPFLPAGITRMARDAGADPGFDAWAFQYTATVARAKAEKEHPVRTLIGGESNPLVDSLDQIVRAHAPIYEKFVADTSILPQRFDEYTTRTGITYDLFATGAKYGMPFAPDPIVRTAWEIVRNPARPISALMEMPYETAVGVKSLLYDVAPRFLANPGEIPGAVPKAYTAFMEEFSTDPVGVMTKTGAGAAVGTGAVRAVRPITAPLASRITEIGIKVRTPAAHRPAVGAISDIGRNVPGLRSTIEVDPNLSQILNIGRAAPVVEEVLTKQPHTIYGSSTHLGQMPRTKTPGGVKDLDVFVDDPHAFNIEMSARLGPDYIVEGNVIRRRLPSGQSPHAVDTHQFPEGYPGAPGSRGVRVVYEDAQKAPNLPFDYMPGETLTAGKLTQEYLYTQTQRVASSVIGQPEGWFRWRFGPPEHRMKDVSRLIAETEWLAASTRQRMPTLGPIKRIVAGYKVRKLEKAVKTLRSDPLIKGVLVEPVDVPNVADLPTITVASPSPRSVVRPTSILGVAPSIASPHAARSPDVLSPTHRSPSRFRGPASPMISTIPSRPRPPLATGTSPPSPRSPSPIRSSPSPILGSLPGGPSPDPISPTMETPSGTTIPGIPGMAGIPTVPRIPAVPRISPPVIAPPRRTQKRDDDQRRRRDKWDEFYLNYAERPNPLASLEEAYTDAPAPKIRPAKMLENIERITVGSVPKIQPIRAKVVKVGPPVKRARQKVPWDVTTTPTRRARPTRRQAAPAVNLDFLGIGVAPAKRKRKSKKRR